MKLAIQGCSHGELDAIYSSLLRTERQQNISIDALLLCGDFQAVRNHSDLRALNVPPKYLRLGDFHAYYSGAKLAPILTLVIGGNHEASNYMHELYHGGWLAPNIYFIGAAGVVELNGLVVSGVSGIYNRHNYRKGRFEKLPYDANALRSCYHTREFDVVRLKAMKHTAKGKNKQVDVVMSHDWPNTIEQWDRDIGITTFDGADEGA
uniref:Related to lariat-debranching enzyme n=1 Tax=Melanopsichium pennsylvanicum 4 TaxID=1398559 RepID=A0A077R4W0_9BASI|nr:related to lariat-debranching enzyme [Melanopsichium pennsylvanicum 4]